MIELEFLHTMPSKGSHTWQVEFIPVCSIFRNSFGNTPFWSITIGFLFWQASLTINL